MNEYESTYLLFPMMTPTRSPFCTPIPISPLANALICLSNSWKSQARCVFTPRLRDGGPPCARGDSSLAINAGLAPCFARISVLKYSGRVFIDNGGSKGPSTVDLVNRYRFACNFVAWSFRRVTDCHKFVGHRDRDMNRVVFSQTGLIQYRRSWTMGKVDVVRLMLVHMSFELIMWAWLPLSGNTPSHTLWIRAQIAWKSWSEEVH